MNVAVFAFQKQPLLPTNDVIDIRLSANMTSFLISIPASVCESDDERDCINVNIQKVKKKLTCDKCGVTCKFLEGLMSHMRRHMIMVSTRILKVVALSQEMTTTLPTVCFVPVYVQLYFFDFIFSLYCIVGSMIT